MLLILRLKWILIIQSDFESTLWTVRFFNLSFDPLLQALVMKYMRAQGLFDLSIRSEVLKTDATCSFIMCVDGL